MNGMGPLVCGRCRAADTVVRQFSTGTTSTTVGIAAAAKDVELTGPQALTSEVAGQLFVLRSDQRRILKFNSESNLPADPKAILKNGRGYPGITILSSPPRATSLFGTVATSGSRSRPPQ